ncbi:MAG: 16S rRNA (uracil(1498)-N(3))-methyltransferase, partial [Deltaproteobacteria bacterium]|nr:16S rRNA (uracil(1498)-N(3))-methyltransferase [Deltaproteobacteria bacterium]
TLFDGRGGLATGVLLESGRCRVDAPTLAPRLVPALTLLLAMPKGKKLDACVRSATELGVGSIQLATSERTQQAAPKLERLVRVLREAARQSEQLHMPTLLSPAPLLEVAPHASEAVRCWGCFARVRSDDSRRAPSKTPDEVVVAVGPEGGFTPDEVDALVARGYRPLSLGPGVLRVETAVPAALALARARLR